MEEDIFIILRDCGYLEDYDTIYVLVDARNLADHTPGLHTGEPFADDSLHGGGC